MLTPPQSQHALGTGLLPSYAVGKGMVQSNATSLHASVFSPFSSHAPPAQHALPMFPSTNMLGLSGNPQADAIWQKTALSPSLTGASGLHATPDPDQVANNLVPDTRTQGRVPQVMLQAWANNNFGYNDVYADLHGAALLALGNGHQAQGAPGSLSGLDGLTNNHNIPDNSGAVYEDGQVDLDNATHGSPGNLWGFNFDGLLNNHNIPDNSGTVHEDGQVSLDHAALINCLMRDMRAS